MIPAPVTFEEYSVVQFCTARRPRRCHDRPVIEHGITAAELPTIRHIAAAPGSSPPMVRVDSEPDVSLRWWHQSAVVLGDVGLCLVLGVLFPFAILAVGMPIALLVLALIELINRF